MMMSAIMTIIGLATVIFFGFIAALVVVLLVGFLWPADRHAAQPKTQAADAPDTYLLGSFDELQRHCGQKAPNNRA